MEKENHNHNYSKNIAMIIGIIVFLLILAIVLPQVINQKSVGTKTSQRNSNAIEVKNSDGKIQENSPTITGQINDGSGVATVQDISGNNLDSQSSSNTETLLEGKEINIEK